MNFSWIHYALMTVVCWGVYGVILHMARGYMPEVNVKPPTVEGMNAGLKAFLLVCVAYAITGGIAFAVLKARGSAITLSSDGITWGLVAGLAGALGALALVLALGAAGSIYKAAAAGAVMPIVFGLAPIVNTVTAMVKGKISIGSVPVPFFIGCALAAVGAYLVSAYAPTNTGGGSHEAPPAAASTPKH
jgi:hypothetical protein